jgi:hypothetical protein
MEIKTRWGNSAGFLLLAPRHKDDGAETSWKNPGRGADKPKDGSFIFVSESKGWFF